MADGEGGGGSVDRADGCVGGGLPEATELTEVKKVTEVTVMDRCRGILGR